jgi:1-deoxy-D-xylulose-5-phosphate reductoisomerase
VAPQLLTAAPPLRFFDPDPAQFPCLRLALEAAAAGGTMCAVLNGANDTAVQAYLDGHVEFADIPRIISETMEQHRPTAHPTLDDILTVDAWARRTAGERILQCLPR